MNCQQICKVSQSADVPKSFRGGVTFFETTCRPVPGGTGFISSSSSVKCVLKQLVRLVRLPSCLAFNVGYCLDQSLKFWITFRW